MKCKQCKEKTPEVNVENGIWALFYCSPECKEAWKRVDYEKGIELAKTHNPEDRHVKTKGELRAMACGAPTSKTPKNKKKGNRKCGKCGMSGHNARTCTKGMKKEDVRYSKPKKKKLNTCGRCGGKGHNARTCGKMKR